LPSAVLRVLVWIAIGLFVLGLLTGQFSSYMVFTVTTIGIYAIAAIGQDWLVGQAGQVSLGGAAFMSLGAFTVVATRNNSLHEWPIQMALAGVIGGAAGLVIGVIALRFRHFYLLLATLAFQFIVLTLTQKYQGKHAAGYTIDLPSVRSWHISTDKGLLGFVTVVLVVAAIFTASVQRRAPGRYWRAIRENEVAAASLGIGVVRWKLLAFVASSALTAVAGAMYAWVVGIVTYDTFSLQLALNLAVMVFFGGRGSILGPILGAAAVTMLPQGLDDLATSLPNGSSFSHWLTVNNGVLATGIYGLVLLIILLVEPQGVLGLFRRAGRYVDRLVLALQHRPVRPQPRVAVPAPAGITAPVDGPDLGTVTGGAVDVAEPDLAGPDRSIDGAHSRPVAAELEHISVRYQNGAVGIEDLSLSLPEGAIVGLIGRNGSGKTSSIRAIAGFPSSERTQIRGTVRIDGTAVRRHDPRSMRAAGVVLVPERDKAFPSLTVAEHFQVAGVSSARVDEILDAFPVLADLRNRRAGYLSGGERQSLALATAVAVGPKVLLIDEPSLGLSPLMTQTLIEALLQLREAHPEMTMILTEQATETLKSVADYFYVLDGGRVVYSGSVDVLNRREVQEAVMGR
jgi:branched-chain amino acid transport system permease protein